MTLISVLIVFALEYYFRWGAEYRSFDWFVSLQEKLEDLFGEQSFFDGWGGTALILLTPVILLWLLINLFSGFLYWLLFFVVSCAVLFLSLGPKPLFASLEAYFEAMQRGDEGAGYLALQLESGSGEISEGGGVYRNATRVILIESQSRYFGVVFWFIFLGPFGALFYRLAHQYYCSCQQNGRDEHLSIMKTLLHWLDWAPVRITSFLFLLVGDFVNGFHRVKNYFVDLKASNRQIICETGIAALGIDLTTTKDGEIQENYKALALVERTLIIYLVVVAVLTPLTY